MADRRWSATHLADRGPCAREPYVDFRAVRPAGQTRSRARVPPGAPRPSASRAPRRYERAFKGNPVLREGFSKQRFASVSPPLPGRRRAAPDGIVSCPALLFVSCPAPPPRRRTRYTSSFSARYRPRDKEGRGLESRLRPRLRPRRAPHNQHHEATCARAVRATFEKDSCQHGPACLPGSRVRMREGRR